MSDRDPLLDLLSRFASEGVEYVLVGGQAVRLNGYLRATEDVDVLVRASRDNGERVIRALRFLAASKELDPGWFVPAPGSNPENIRVADELLIDLLFSANGHSYEAVQPWVRQIEVEGTPIKVLNIDGLIMTKTDYREKDVLDKQMLSRIKQQLEGSKS
jgi:hypothetical protein